MGAFASAPAGQVVRWAACWQLLQAVAAAAGTSRAEEVPDAEQELEGSVLLVDSCYAVEQGGKVAATVPGQQHLHCGHLGRSFRSAAPFCHAPTSTFALKGYV